jgi:tRNA pseudouridine38-40 synthase
MALLLAYDGTAFAGSQAQAVGLRTVQGELEAALERLTGERRRVRFAGRTDAGVHALGQVCSFDTQAALGPQRFAAALNRYLPDDLAVRAACEVSSSFDPRRAAIARRYAYRIEHGGPRSPLTRLRAWQLRPALDVAAMVEAASGLPRERTDWSAFAGALGPQRSPWRTLLDCRVEPRGPRALAVTVEAESFLPQQVRRIVGALARVGERRLTPQAFAALIEGPPCSAGPVAPPHGLTLLDVRYPPGTLRWTDECDDDADE